MKTANEATPFIAIHPGEFLKDEINARNLSLSYLAKDLSLTENQLNEIVQGKRNIDADIALLLESALGIDSDFWVEAQKNYNLDMDRMKKGKKRS